jgi:hypothetical protein
MLGNVQTGLSRPGVATASTGSYEGARHDLLVPASRSVGILDAIKLKTTLLNDGSDPRGAQYLAGPRV